MEVSDRSAALRLLDASLNRASEGARVVEDYTRFVLDDAHLTERAKRLRHAIATAGAIVADAATRLAMRDAPGDVGASISTATELQRCDAWQVCLASLHRLQQALRSLEEYSKTIDANAAAAFEQLRYDAYSLGSALGATQRGRTRLGDVRLYVLIDGRASTAAFERLVVAVCEGGADIVQLRDKRLGDRSLAERAKRFVAITRSAGVISIVNDRPDLALVAGADGVHVGQEELTVAAARRVLGPNRLVGVSTHSIEQARDAVQAGADYLGVGPTFPTPTKAFDRFPGLGLVRQVAEEIRLPAFAIGGINARNLPEVLAAGARGVAVASAVTEAPDPAAAATELRRLLRSPIGEGPPRG